MISTPSSGHCIRNLPMFWPPFPHSKRWMEHDGPKRSLASINNFDSLNKKYKSSCALLWLRKYLNESNNPSPSTLIIPSVVLLSPSSPTYSGSLQPVSYGSPCLRFTHICMPFITRSFAPKESIAPSRPNLKISTREKRWLRRTNNADPSPV